MKSRKKGCLDKLKLSVCEVKGHMQGCHSQGKISENEIFSRSGKSRGILWMAREI